MFGFKMITNDQIMFGGLCRNCWHKSLKPDLWAGIIELIEKLIKGERLILSTLK